MDKIQRIKRKKMIMTEIIQVMTEKQGTTTIPMTRVEIQKSRRVKKKREMT